MIGLLKLLMCSVVNGVTAEAEINPRTAADGRHPPVITAFSLPEQHSAWDEGTIMVQAMDGTDPIPGQATALSSSATSNIIGVLQRHVAENETSGNVVIHGSVPAEILKYVPSTGPVDATAGQIAALRAVGVYV
ncbi:MAG: hypothetical protein FWB73_03125 [Treponema sp.]|nr:hypothetical protein [Treponema sp.]